MDMAAPNNAEGVSAAYSARAWIRCLMGVLAPLATKAWFAYGCLVLLQLKVVWHIWHYRDTTSGDTSGYFGFALTWLERLQNSFAWSPLYTAFYGTLLYIVPDAHSATVLHRLLIVFTASLLVLTLMRRLLPPAIALLVSAWWAILPINFDTLYEVHLFTVLPTLLICIIATRRPSSWVRGVALGIFIVASFLVRNEFFIASGLWAVICLIGEWVERRSQKQPLRLYLVAYGLPSVLALGLSACFYARSLEQGADLQALFGRKHTLNVCQIYAFNYQQRYKDWQLNPWTQCQDLMQRDFGVPQPSMLEAIRRNPRAMAAYFLWNLRLVPAGVQKLLFNSTTDIVNPDYVQTRMRDPMASVFTLVFLVIVYIGGRHLWHERHYWWATWCKDRSMGWLAMLCTVVVVGVLMLMQRPRPSYMFSLSVCLMAVFGMALYVMLHHMRRLEWLAALVPLVMGATIIFVPPYYTATYNNIFGFQGRPVMTAYRRLAPFAALFNRQRFGIHPHASTFGRYLPAYQCAGLSDEEMYQCDGLSYEEIMSGRPDTMPVAAWLEQQGIGLLYIDETYIAQPIIRDFLNTLDPAHWRVVVDYNASDGRWLLLQHSHIPAL